MFRTFLNGRCKKVIETIDEALTWIHGRLKFGSRPGLLRIEALLKMVGNPEVGPKFIHIAGTNGKGSTVKFLATLLQEIGLNVGTYTSPYIVKFNERIQLNGQFISDAELIELVNYIIPFVAELDEDPELTGITEFEIITVLGFLFYKKHDVDVAVIEVGLGGLLDSTNVLTPQLVGITTIGLDHVNILGHTLAEIAFQKAGIIKTGVPVVTGNIGAEALAVIDEVAAQKGTAVTKYQVDYQTEKARDLPFGESFNYAGPLGHFDGLKINLIGHHQVENAAMALTLFLQYAKQEKLAYTVRDVKQALLQTSWPARMEVMNTAPLILLDGAHNHHAVVRLVDNIKSRFRGRNVWLLYSAINTKDIHEMMKDLKKLPYHQLTLTTFDYPKALTVADYQPYEDERTKLITPWQQALPEIIQQMDEEDVLIVTGSLYFSSQVREVFKGGPDGD